MASGPEHYKAAEEDIKAGDKCFESCPDESSRLYQSAQVHATLALAAATALNDHDGGLTVTDWNAWQDTCGEKATA